MTTSLDDFDAIVEDIESDESDEAYRRPVRTPSRRASFQSRSAGTASQGQVQATARSLDAKIETLAGAVRTLETRVSGLASAQSKTTAVLRKESVERRKALDGVRADLQQTKMLSVLLPLISTSSVTITGTVDGKDASQKVLVPQDNQFATLLPLLLLMSPPSGGDAAKSGLSDPMTMVLLFSVLGKK